jgi:hypothetical protein
VRQPFDQIGAAIPFRALRRVRLIGAATKEQQLPAGDDKPLIERKRKLVRAGRRMNGLPCHQVRVERLVIFVGHIGEVIVGKCRIQVLPVAIDSRPHGTTKGGFRPPADPGLGIRCNIGGKDRAERRRHRKSTGKVLAAAHGMAIVAIADRGQLAASLDQGGIERLRRGRIDRSDRRPPPDRKGRNPARNQERRDNATDNS